MNKMKILLIGNTKYQQHIFKEAVEAFNKKNDLTVEYGFAEDATGALDQIDDSYDGVIIDMRLGEANGSGNEIVRRLHEASIVLPVIFVTAYPDLAVDHPLIIKKRNRYTETYEWDLLRFQETYDAARANNETTHSYTVQKLAEAAVLQKMHKRFGPPGVSLTPLIVELRKSMERSGIRPEDNEFSRAIIAAREE